ncbi:uncharacterized protein LOC143195433 isoform X1 [Rhynchophorus ferrugineus]|uniref:uncharacterized protein LOC143195433 isoform X1 n=1 Tax=Rhynchophorus ferrugineus TaxID=354439 RepID=UPI003FCD9059
MYDDTDAIDNAPVYNRGDIVWVKLSGCWWPGEVKNIEDVPQELLSQFRKAPLVIVKFFDEDSYEYVKNWAHIYPYNCEKKNDFIKKGMVGFRSKSSHMSKFPTDIGTAEERTNGNPNILSLPEFLPVKKINYDEIFGSSLAKKPKLSSTKKITGKDASQPLITHRRFVGKDDYKAYIRLQYPGKYILCDSDEEEIKKLNREPTKDLNCRFCSFITKRLEVMILHAKTHLKANVTSSAKRKSMKSKNVILTDSESESEMIKSSRPRQKKKKGPKSKKQNSYSHLEDWCETDEELQNNKSENKGESVVESDSKENSKNADNSIASPVNKNTQEDIKNCFDFEEEDEDEIMLPSSIGRKIPRVLPEKPKTNISELIEEESEKKISDEAGDLLQVNEKSTNQPIDINVTPNEGDETIDKAFNELMEETSVPKLDDITQTLKPEQNFHDATTIKYPDKGGTASEGGTSKRKCITSFEDFETGFQERELKQQSDVNDKITDTAKRSDEMHEGSCSISKEWEKSNENEITEAVKIANATISSKKAIEDSVNLEIDNKIPNEQEPDVQVETKKSTGTKKHAGRKSQRFPVQEDLGRVGGGQSFIPSEENTEIVASRRGRPKKKHEAAYMIQSDDAGLISQEPEENTKPISDSTEFKKINIHKTKKGKQKSILPEKRNSTETDVPKSDNIEATDNKLVEKKRNEKVDKSIQDHIEKHEGKGRRSKNKKRHSKPEIVVGVVENEEAASKSDSSELVEGNSDPSPNVEKVKSFEGPVTAELSFQNFEEMIHKRNDLPSTKGRRKKSQTAAVKSKNPLDLEEKSTIAMDEIQAENKEEKENAVDASKSSKQSTSVSSDNETNVSVAKQGELNEESSEHKRSTSYKSRRRRKHSKSDLVQIEKNNKEPNVEVFALSKEKVENTELETEINVFSNNSEVKTSIPEDVSSKLVDNTTVACVTGSGSSDIEQKSETKPSIEENIVNRILSMSAILTVDTNKSDSNEAESCESPDAGKSGMAKSDEILESTEYKNTNTKAKRGRHKRPSKGEHIHINRRIDSDILETEGTETNSEKSISPSRQYKRQSPSNNKTTIIKPINKCLPKSVDQSVFESAIEENSPIEDDECPIVENSVENNSETTITEDVSEKILHLNTESKDGQINNTIEENSETEKNEIIKESNDDEASVHVVNQEHTEPETISSELQVQMAVIESPNESVIQTQFLHDKEQDKTIDQEAEVLEIKEESMNTSSVSVGDVLEDDISRELENSENKVNNIAEEANKNIEQHMHQCHQEDLCETAATVLDTLNVENEVNVETSCEYSTVELHEKLSNVENMPTDVLSNQKELCIIHTEMETPKQVTEAEELLKTTEIDSDSIEKYNTSEPVDKNEDKVDGIVEESENVTTACDTNNAEDKEPDNEKQFADELNERKNSCSEKDEHISTDRQLHTISGPLEKDKRCEDKNFEESELILPLKKSKRANDISQFIDSQKDNTNAGLENKSSDNSVVQDSSHLEQPDSSDHLKCVPPKKKKIDSLNDQITSDISKSEEIPQPPKKKMQKLFESSQALEKSHDMPLMSPLAKKKNFLFQKEDYEQELETKQTRDNIKLKEEIKVDQSVESIQQSHASDLLSSTAELPNEQCDRSGDKNDEGLEKSVDVNESEQKAGPIEAIDKSDSYNASENSPDIDFEIEQKPLIESSLTTNEILNVIGITNNTDSNLSGEFKQETEIKPLSTSVEVQENNEKHVTVEEKEDSKALLLESSEMQNEPGSEEVNKDKSIDSPDKVESDALNTPEMHGILDPTIPGDIPFLPESELVPIEGTLTVMSEKDLADSQVEITPDKVISEKKPMTLGAFSMDFADVSFDNNTKCPKEKKIPKTPESIAKISTETRPIVSQSNRSYKSELLDILEGNSDSSESDSKYKSPFDGFDKKTPVTDMFDFEDAIPSQIVLSNKIQSDSVLLDSPKLLERLSMSTDSSKKITIQSDLKVNEGITKAIVNKPKPPIPKPGRKIIIKTSKTGPLTKSSSGGKPIILSEQIIRPANPPVSTKDQSQGIKRHFEDIEDVETAFIIPKVAKKSVEEEVIALTPDKTHILKQPTNKANVKAKILQQTIITSKGEIIQPQTTTTTTTTQSTPLQTDEIVFDINSMPIVLSDDLLSPESIQNMPVVLSEEMQKVTEKASGAIIKKAVSTMSSKQQIVFKTTQATTGTVIGKQGKPRILSNATPTTKINKPGAALLATLDGKPTKYVLVPSSMSATLSAGKTLKTVIKKQTPTPSKQQPVPQTSEIPSQPVGNKIMIVTNQHGQQHRVVLTPQHQKLIMQAQSGPKVTKTVIKGGIPKSRLESTSAGPSGIVPKTTLVTQNIISSASSVVSNTSGLLMPIAKNVKAPTQTKKVSPKIPGKPQKTILIKNQLGQTVRRIQGTDDAELDRQVAEQLEAIKARSRQQQGTKSQDVISLNRQIPANKIAGPRRFIKKPDVLMKSKTTLKSSENTVPALAPISPQPKLASHLNLKSSSVTEKSTDALLQVSVANQSDTKLAKTDMKPDRPLNQLVIQDALGNQTTITEGQILALPSETVDGQPQSYMLVTLDETGNLTPLNNEALMSLDPSLGVGGDINNVVLQVDQGQGIMAAVKQTETPVNQKKVQAEDRLKTEPKKIIQGITPKMLPDEQTKVQELPTEINREDPSALSSDAPLGGQQLIVTGDPIATQKFLESLSDGTTDLANILANADGGSVIIQADGQQIFIKTNSSDAQSMVGLGGSPEGAGNPVFSSHKPNQDILAAALADTDVFQQTDQSLPNSSVKSQLSPGGGTSLYPMHVGNVLETSLTLSSPIMTPLEVPSTNSKKIDDQADILNQVPKNVDLPITITDPNISQTVSHQQSAGLMELTLRLTETTSSSDMNSPSSYAYTLPTLDEAVGMTQKPFNSSMPLLTDDVTEVEGSRSMKKKESLIGKDIDDHSTFDSLQLIQDTIETSKQHNPKSDTFGDINTLPILTEDVVEDSTSSIDSTKVARSSPKSKDHDIVNEGLCTLGGEMCSSLSEPPPDMFDLGPMITKEEEISSDISSVPEGTVMSPNSETSGEIPLQPQIVATLNDLKRPCSETENEQNEKRQKFE